ncbi:MAG: corA [Haloplasmataceae bacterium]|jgi:magnesium transporter|nr:corA [Haloplasmataceae bacterium]
MKIYKNNNSKIDEIQTFERNSWINLINPTNEEIALISTNFNINIDDIFSVLDEEEKARVEKSSTYTLIIFDTPIYDLQHFMYTSLPIAIFYIENKDVLITVSLIENELIKIFESNTIKDFNINKKSRFLYTILIKNTGLFLTSLQNINKKLLETESELKDQLSNEGLIKLTQLDKSLVYLTTSLKANKIVLEKIIRQDIIKQYEEDKNLLEDLIIENEQALEMSDVYSNILQRTSTLFSSIISNNLNIVMKRLSIIMAILTIPTMIFSFYGMNVILPFQEKQLATLFILLFAISITILASYLLLKRRKF